MSEYEEEQPKLRLDQNALPHALVDQPQNMDWGQWFVQWDVACDSFHRAYRDEKTCSTVLGSIVANQQRLMNIIPPGTRDSDAKKKMAEKVNAMLEALRNHELFSQATDEAQVISDFLKSDSKRDKTL